MSLGFRKPVKRTKRLVQKGNEEKEPEVSSVEDLVKKKKLKIEREKTLESLFHDLEKERDRKDWDSYAPKQHQELILEVPIPFDDEYLLESDPEDIYQDDLKDKAKTFMRQDEQENLEIAFQETKKVEEKKLLEKSWRRTFFKPGVKFIRQPCLISRESMYGQKEIHLSELSATSEGRSFLLASGCMKDWYNSAWKCPHYIYQWLFEVVALEPNKITVRNALSTLLALWTLPGDKVQYEYSKIFKQRYIKLDTFKSVLLAYHALSSEMVDYVHTGLKSYGSYMEDVFDDSHKLRHIPLSQLGLMVKAFGFSIKLWKNAYMPWEIRYTIRILLQLSLDKAGCLIIQEIQTSIDNCLSALKDLTWEIDVKNIANDICDIITSTKQRVHLLDAVKTTYVRSRHLRRVIGVTCLERSLEDEVPGSIDSIPTENGIIQQTAAIFSYPGGFFMERQNIDYEECWIRISMLDAALGASDTDILREKETILVIADELRLIGLQIGAKVGVMKKTLANEIIQRVWGRISFIVGRDHKIES